MSKKEETPKDHSYFHERLDPLGWTPERGSFTTTSHRWENGAMRPVKPDEHDYREYSYQLFDVDKEGNLVINYYRITGLPATYRQGDGPARNYTITRLRNPELSKDGDPIKYRLPKGAGTFPWFGPRLIEAYRAGTAIEALVLTEGALKAYALENAGAHCVGLTSITHAKDRDKSADQLHQDVIDLIRRCTPKKVVYLVDGDCRHFSRKWKPDGEEHERDVDLFTRPNQFYSSAKTMRDLLQDLSNELGFSIWFKHVESAALENELEKGATLPKGADDLLLTAASVWVRNAEAAAPRDWAELPPAKRAGKLKELRLQAQREAHAAIVKELNASSGPSQYFFRKNLDRLGELKKYFAISSAADFYAEYSERLGDRPFVFAGTKYQHDGKELVVVLPAVMRSYVRVGDTYYERVPIPNRFGVPEEKLHVRQKSTIVDDHGKEMVRRIQKLKAFCNVPSHEDYQPIIANCLNRYQPFEHKPEPGEFPHIERFMRHIFGTGTVEVPHPKKREEDGRPVMMKVGELELGYDYMQLLYRQPTQMLPILCLVSKENETGKSTFAKLLKAIYTGNAANVSSQDLQSDFNEHWISKLLVIVEEAFIEKKATIERIKDLSTANVAMVNSKGIQQQEIEVFLHFLICSNNVRNFVTATNDDIRYWVRNVPVIPPGEKHPDLLKLMYEEIPAFLHFLGKRSMVTENLSRMWFYPGLLETEALRLVRESSQPVVKRQLEGWLKAMFLATRAEEILMAPADIKREVFRGQGYDEDYIKRVVKEDMGVERWRNDKGEQKTRAYSYWRWVEKRDPLTNVMEHTVEEVRVRQAGRPFWFKREDFFSEDHWDMLQPDPAVMAGNILRGTHGMAPAPAPVTEPVNEEDLPF